MKYLSKFNENVNEDFEQYLNDVFAYVTDETRVIFSFDKNKDNVLISIFLKKENVEFDNLIKNKKANLDILNEIDNSIEKIKNEYDNPKIKVDYNHIDGIIKIYIYLKYNSFYIEKDNKSIFFLKNELIDLLKIEIGYNLYIATDGSHDYLNIEYNDSRKIPQLRLFWQERNRKEFLNYWKSVLKIEDEPLPISINISNYDKQTLNINGVSTKTEVFKISIKLSKKHKYAIWN
jgi:hypothetical protein